MDRPATGLAESETALRSRPYRCRRRGLRYMALDFNAFEEELLSWMRIVKSEPADLLDL